MSTNEQETNVDKTFRESAGTAANEHAKRKAKEKSEASKKEKIEEVFFTVKGNKILQIKVRPNGAYSSYISKKSKLKKEVFEAHVKAWKKEGSWIPEEGFDEKVSEIQKKLAEKALSAKK